jgi:SAM-dependent methyltransferase
VLDISGAALEASVRRLGENAVNVRWIEADITQYPLDEECDLWHDRAVFHFLTDLDDRRAYLRAMGKAVQPGGHVVISTFGPDGPSKCSGLPVMRYSPATLQAQVGEDYDLLESREEIHVAPSGHRQQFICCLFRKNV